MTLARALPITAYTATCAMGRGIQALRSGLAQSRSFLTPCDFMGLSLPTFVGEVLGVDDERLPDELTAFDCRNNRLAAIGLKQDGFADAVRRSTARFGVDRVGVFLGSSTSGLLQTEIAYRHRDSGTGALPGGLDYAHTHNMYSLARFVRAALGLNGPASVTSIACASSSKVFASAARAIAAGVVDAAVVGGVDTLCLTTLYGFGSLELLSTEPCRPYDVARNGISIGEASAFALLERSTDSPCQSWLVGWGESSDAYHMSTPHPEGAGARAAMQKALSSAGLDPTAIDYVNLHGTATPSNDRSEDLAVWSVFGDRVPVSSTKGAHGHTLGAAGALEAIVGLLAIADGVIPGGCNLRERDTLLRCDYRHLNASGPIKRVMSNSFGFGGANCALILSGTGAQ